MERDSRAGRRFGIVFEKPIVAMCEGLPFRVLNEGDASTTGQFVRINFRGSGELR